MKTVISVVNMGESVRHEVYKRNLGIGNPKWRETMRRKTRLNVLVPAILCAFPSAVFATAWGVQTLITGYYVYDAGCVASATSGQTVRRKMRDFDLLRAPRRESEVNEQTRISTIHSGAED